MGHQGSDQSALLGPLYAEYGQTRCVHWQAGFVCARPPWVAIFERRTVQGQGLRKYMQINARSYSPNLPSRKAPAGSPNPRMARGSAPGSRVKGFKVWPGGFLASNNCPTPERSPRPLMEPPGCALVGLCLQGRTG